MKREWTKYDATLEARAYEYALRIALRKCGLYLRARSEAKVIGLRLPDGAALEVYREALRVLLKATETLDQYHVAMVELGKRGETFCEDAWEVVRMRSAVVVMIQHGSTMSFEFELAFDKIVAVDPLRPAHLMSAAREAWKMDIGRENANALVQYPPALLFAALRRGRPVDVVLAKLAGAAKPPMARRWEPLLEELEGYGEARIWGEALVADIADWRSGRIAWRDVDAGLLLSGPPGTGKTLFAASLARSCGTHFIATSSSQWQAKGHLGDMLGAMRRTFREAREHAPAVLFIDEIDSIGDRGALRGDNANYGRQVINALLELLDGSEPLDGVVVIAASNYPDVVDPALRRPGRLDRHIVIGLPDQRARAQMLAVHLGSGSIDATALNEAARSMSGYSGALIAQVAKDARRIARREGREAGVGDILSLVPPLAAMDRTELWETCLHEAGHAIVGLEFGVALLEFIAVAREVGHLDEKAGHVHWKRLRRRNRSHQSYLDELAMIMAGMAAEKVFIGDVLDGSGGTEGSDLHRACDLATLMTISLGLGSLQFLDVSTPGELDRLRKADRVLRKQVEDLLAQQLERATQVVRARRADIEALAGQLMEKGIMSGEEVARMLERLLGDQSAA